MNRHVVKGLTVNLLATVSLALTPGCGESDEEGAGSAAGENEVATGPAGEDTTAREGAPGPVPAGPSSPSENDPQAEGPAGSGEAVLEPGGASQDESGDMSMIDPAIEPSAGEGADPPAPEPETDPEEVPARASTGCGGNAAPPDGALSMDVDGTERFYIVDLPDGYDPSTPYPVVFAFHGLGGSAELVSGNRVYFGFGQSGGAPMIFVYPDGLDTGDGNKGWPNTGGQDVAFFDALMETLQADYCVDSERVFSTGHSYGGMMSHTLGCQRADVLRAIAPVAGAMFGRGGDCAGPIAAWGAHGDPDGTVDYDSGLSAIERVMEVNGCDPDSGTPVEPTEFCTQYECDAAYPVTWCVHDEDHNWPDFATEWIKAFFDSF